VVKLKKKYHAPRNLILATFARNKSIRKTAEILKINRRTVNEVLDQELENYKSPQLTEEQNNNLIEDLKSSNDTLKNLSEKYNVGQYVIDRYYNAYVKKNNDRKKRFVRNGNHIYNEDCFEKIDSEEKAYWLGFILSDGSISSEGYRISLEIGTIDIGHLEKFKKFIDCNYDILTRERNGYLRSSLRVTSKKIAQDLFRLGFINNKTYEMESLIEKIPNELRRHFLRGIFDGDGGIYTYEANDCKILLSGLESIVMDFRSYFKIDEEKISKRKVIGKKRNYDYHSRIYLGGNKQCKRILDELYKDSNIYLDRKYNKYKDHFKDYKPKEN